jgi:hypothetical protein
MLNLTLTRQQGRQVFAICVTLLLTLIYLHTSELAGRLAGDLSPDDVGYANDAARRLAIAAKQGLLSLVRDFLAVPPHSPFATVLAMSAFAIGGVHDFVLYAANVTILLIAALFITSELRDRPTSTWILAIAILLLSPIAYRAVHDFRPDIAVGLVTAIMVSWFVTGLITGQGKPFFKAGIAFAACLLIKPSFFVHTAAIAGALVTLFFVARISNGEIGTARHQNYDHLMRFLLLGLLIAAPYFLFNGGAIFHYFWDNTRGADAAIWSFDKNTPLPQLLKETILGSFPLLGYHVAFAVVTLAIAGGFLVVTDDRAAAFRLVALSFVAMLSLGIIVIGRHKNEFFLATFQWLLLIATVHAIDALWAHFRGKWRIGLLAVSVIALTIVVVSNGSIVHWTTSPEALPGTSWNERIVSVVTEDRIRSVGMGALLQPPTVLLSFAGPVNSDSVRWVATKKGLQVNAIDHHRSADIEQLKAAAGASEYVVVPNQASANYYRWLPSASIQGAFLDWILQNPDFHAITSMASTANYYIFRNARLASLGGSSLATDGLPDLKGFLPEEGPYPQWTLPRVRWMSSNPAEICTLSDRVVARTASLRFRADSSGKLRISLDGGPELRSIALAPGQFDVVSMDYTPKQKRSCLHLVVELDKTIDPARLLLFSNIEIHEAKPIN